jgi:histidinol-phosphate/aromatic aminotransferase/cobyric acid decarboxylase-like protein
MARGAEASLPAAPREHGGALAAELEALGLGFADVLDLSQSVNRYGPCPAVAAAVRAAPIERYPDPTARGAREALGRALGVSPRALVIGNGAADLLWTLARVVLSPGDAVALVEPTFSEPSAAARACGARVVAWRADAERGFAVDLGAVGELARRSAARLIHLCTPNNPTGVALPVAEVAAFARSLPDVLVAVDEAFLSLSERHADASFQLPANAVRIRSLTKDLGVPGVRAGYLLCAEDLATRLEAERPPWTTSAAAEAAVVAASEARPFVAESRALLLAERDRLTAELRASGLWVQQSATIFLLVRVGDGAGLRRVLLERHRVLVRDCSSFGLPEFVRVAVGTRADGDRLLRALRLERFGGAP